MYSLSTYVDFICSKQSSASINNTVSYKMHSSDKDTLKTNFLDDIIKELSLLRGGEVGSGAGEGTGGTKKRGRGANTTNQVNLSNQSVVGGAGGEGEVAHLKSIVVLLLEAVKHLTEQQGSNEEREGGKVVKDLQDSLRRQEDELDEVKQRSLKGNIILSSDRRNGSVIKSDEELKRSGKSICDHTLDLIREKYNVLIPIADVQACHRLKNNNSIILRIWNRAPGSAWWSFIDAIKSGMNRSYNLFANFQLTSRRNELSYHLRKMRKEKKISKIYTNENGQLCFKVHDQGEKIKVTYFSKNSSDCPCTWSTTDIDKFVSKK